MFAVLSYPISTVYLHCEFPCRNETARLLLQVMQQKSFFLYIDGKQLPDSMAFFEKNPISKRSGYRRMWMAISGVLTDQKAGGCKFYNNKEDVYAGVFDRDQ